MTQSDSDGISRRDALSIMGVVPLAAALGTTPEVVERALRRAQQARQQQTPLAPKFFTDHEWRTVRVLVDLIIPRDERSGSATEAGVPEFMDFMMMDRPGMQGQMRGGLRWLDNESVDRFGKRLLELTADQRTAILDDIAWPRKARPELSQGVAFFNYFRDLTAGGFWSSQMGVQDIGYIGNQFVPVWDGCPPAANRRLGVSHDLMNTRIPFQR
ncbi:MAG TPA: gluconate 2-dehydrogenase subunit 3 family protein [Longimicrobiales bacterium]|nr:gluconate 2-dehydrogenase subunit 3 family protein [Longimicrobiales bacterium]